MDQKGGRALEKTVMKLFKEYEKKGIHCQQNHPEQLMSGLKVRKHGFDFQCFYNNKFYAFDAKHCVSNNFALSNCKIHQIKALSDIQQHGGEGFFLVFYKPYNKLNKLKVNDVISMIEQGLKTTSFSQDLVTSIDILGVF